jgi:hypothetical protein
MWVYLLVAQTILFLPFSFFEFFEIADQHIICYSNFDTKLLVNYLIKIVGYNQYPQGEDRDPDFHKVFTIVLNASFMIQEKGTLTISRPFICFHLEIKS